MCQSGLTKMIAFAVPNVSAMVSRISSACNAGNIISKMIGKNLIELFMGSWYPAGFVRAGVFESDGSFRREKFQRCSPGA